MSPKFQWQATIPGFRSRPTKTGVETPWRDIFEFEINNLFLLSMQLLLMRLPFGMTTATVFPAALVNICTSHSV